MGKEVTQFQLTIGYNRPDSTAVRRAPLTLVGEVAMALIPQNPRDQKLLIVAILSSVSRASISSSCGRRKNAENTLLAAASTRSIRSIASPSSKSPRARRPR